LFPFEIMLSASQLVLPSLNSVLFGPENIVSRLLKRWTRLRQCCGFLTWS